MFYFVHQINLQTIPYVEKQINNFIKYFQQHLNLRTKDVINELPQKDWTQKTDKLMTIMEKKHKQIEDFYYKNWMDYRANLILRSKKLILDFFENNKEYLAPSNTNDTQSQIQHQFDQQKIMQISKLSWSEEQRKNSLEKQEGIIITSIKQSVKRIKTQMAQKSNQQKSKISVKQSRKTIITPFNISKEEINKEVNKIKKKQKIIPQSSTSFVLSSRKKDQPLNEKNKQKTKDLQISKASNNKNRDLNNKLFGSLQKSRQKSKTNTIKTKQINQKSKVNLQKVQQSNFNKSVQKKKQTTSKVNTIRSKNMTKDQYIQHLLSKNRQKNQSSI